MWIISGGDKIPGMERFEDKVKKTFAKRLKQARSDAGFRFAKDFSEALSIEEHTYRAWERGEHLPDIPTMTRICRLLKVEPNDLMPLAVNSSGVAKKNSGTGRSAA